MSKVPLILAACLATALASHPVTLWAQKTQQDTTLEDVQADFSDAFDTIAGYTSDQRDKALEAMETTLSRIDTRIDELETRARDNWAEMSHATQRRTSQALRTLRDSRNRLSEAYGALSQGAGTAWDDLQSGIGSAWQDLEGAWTDAASAIGSEDKAAE